MIPLSDEALSKLQSSAPMAVKEILHHREHVTRLQAANAALVEENRELQAAAFRALNVPVRIFLAPGAHLPRYQTDGAACADLHAFLTEPMEVAPLGCVLVPTGAHVAIPFGYEWQIRGRSGMSSKANWVATDCIDSDYRGEVCVCLANLSNWQLRIEPGQRIAQAKLSPAPRADFRVVKTVEALGVTQRGANGFGSTGAL